ncbi:PiggyBac transposable element-derived protein 4 [Plakobranchus ocellatus]|uniref:PiggyBac transposable element-derived protein 4 n=1 Tax=Plakobranchus ocellatus TaxID=259542 RepID=A0AAV4ARI8_9GAST|nr:PiggyBac transposable element-derived protein 4 [Plakobranchus ocellatus]
MIQFTKLGHLSRTQTISSRNYTDCAKTYAFTRLWYLSKAGRFCVYMKDKSTKWGFKLYELCESRSGYVYSFEMYCADKRISTKPINVITHLIKPILNNKGHRLFLKNYYCCPDMWSHLQPQQTMMIGTCRENRLGMPADLFQGRKCPEDLDYRRKGQLIVTRWFDK